MQIEEPIKIKEKNQNAHEITSIGIDLGTTNCVASFVQNGKISTIEFDLSGDILPSVVAISKDFNVIVGKEALSKRFDENFCVISSSKRKIGSTNESFDVFGKKYSSTQIAALILMKIKESAEKYLGKAINECVITVPAKFDDNQRNETKIAAKIAGFDVKRVINEPTAAALAYGLDNESEGVYVVYDLGGGTFDVSVLSMTMGVFRVIATDGDVEIGGDDIDYLFSQFIAKKYNIINTQKLLIVAKNIKEYLSNNDIFNSKIDIDGDVFDLTLSRKELEDCALVFIEKTIKSVLFAIKESGKREIDGVILVGGMTKMPLIKQEISKILDCKIYTNLDPDKIVGIGAGIKAAGKKSGFENVLLDICPLSLGIETMGGVVEKIIHRNTPIPCTAIQNFTTSIDNQTGIILNIVQGERELAGDCRCIGKISLKNLSPKPAGMVKIEVRFEIDVDGILSVTALDLDTKNYITTEIKPTYGLSYESMSDMLISSIENSKNDMLNRLLAESKEAAKMNIFAIEKAILEDGDLISVEYLEKIEAKITELESLICGSDRDLIEKENKELDKISEKFVEERTNKYLKSVIAGKSINDDLS